MKVNIYLSAIALILISATGCNSGKGQDALLGLAPHPAGTVSPCVRCHTSAISPTLDPLVTNGSGTAGKHVKHVTERGIDCEVCHKNYMTSATHMNGRFDTGSNQSGIINFNVTGPTGTWVYGANPRSGICSSVACHGTDALDWYGTATWSLPSCTTCHSSSFSSALDPTLTNGAPPDGRHVKHVSSRGIDCERCHFQYPAQRTHANGVLDTADVSVKLVQFNIMAPQGSWIGDNGPQTGQCASVSCHGADTVEWYGTSTWSLPSSCTTCHSSSFSSALDPVLTNGSGLSGKHVTHVASLGFACTKCHLGYPARASHMSGSMDTQNPAALIVAFDGTNPLGSWVGDSGPQTGSCSNLACHGTQAPDWYGLAGVTLPSCALCHTSPIGQRRAVMGAGGDFGANASIRSHHVTNGPGSDPVADQCLVCHEMSFHMSGTVRLKNADTGSAIVYAAATPFSLAPFCLSCHDEDGAMFTFRSGGTPKTPFIDGSVMGTAPYRASVDILANWNKVFGHRNQGLTCIGNGTPNTGCHAQAHGSPNVGLLARNLTLPGTKGNLFVTADEPDYDLCFSCHASFPRVTKEAVLGARQGGKYDLEQPSPYFIPAIQTGFRDHNLGGVSGNFYDDPNFFGGFLNLHLFHLQTPNSWLYRDSIPSSIHCLTCHSIHGSNTLFGWVHDDMLFSHFTGTGTDAYGMILVPSSLGFYPTSCVSSCHTFFPGATHSWFEPSGE